MGLKGNPLLQREIRYSKGKSLTRKGNPLLRPRCQDSRLAKGGLGGQAGGRSPGTSQRLREVLLDTQPQAPTWLPPIGATLERGHPSVHRIQPFPCIHSDSFGPASRGSKSILPSLTLDFRLHLRWGRACALLRLTSSALDPHSPCRSSVARPPQLGERKAHAHQHKTCSKGDSRGTTHTSLLFS